MPRGLAVISYTAKELSFDELKQEKDALSEAEAYNINCELHGWNAIWRETAEMRTRGLAELQEALEGVADKEDYLKALEQCPDLVRTESDPILFLRCEDYDTWAAALRLTKYWKVRCQLFKERAFFPMTQTDDGALFPGDSERLRTGAFQLLKNDGMGRSVIYLRRSLVQTTGDRPSVIRLLFYFLCVACEDKVAQRHGLVFVVDHKDVSLENYDRKVSRITVEMLRFATPVKIQAVHVFFPAFRCVAKLFFPTALLLYGAELRKKVSIHLCGGPKEYLMDLQKVGMRADSLPPAMGGSFDVSDFRDELDERLALELSRQQQGQHD